MVHAAALPRSGKVQAGPMSTGTGSGTTGLDAKPDIWLVERFQKTGDHAYFDALHNRYRRELLLDLAKMTGSLQQAEDLVQEALIKAFHSLPQLVLGNFRAWLWTIAKNTAINEFRRRAVRRPLEGQAIIDETRPGLWPRTEESLQVLETLNSIPSHMQKTCLKLSYMCGYQYHEIAALLGMDTESVRSHISNGKRQFRKRWHTVKA